VEKQEKSSLQKVVDLLEENGFHVSKAEEALIESGISSGLPSGVILLRIAPKEEKEQI
jgi:hypothetical protein